MVYKDYEIPFSCKENKIMNFAGQWKELDKIIQSEVSQTRKANVASVIRGS